MKLLKIRFYLRLIYLSFDAIAMKNDRINPAGFLTACIR